MSESPSRTRIPQEEPGSSAVQKLSPNWLRLTRIAWLLLALMAVLLLATSLPAYVLRASGQLPQDAFEVRSTVDAVFDVLSSLASLASALLSLGLSAMFFWKRMEETAVAALAFFLLIYSVVMAGPLELLLTYWGFGDTATAENLQATLVNAPLISIVLLFPNGRFVPSWSRWVLLLSIVAGAVLFFLPSFDVTNLSDLSPFAFSILLAHPIFLLFGLAAQVYRYRAVSLPAERQQTKWVLFGLVVWLAFMLLSSIPYYYLNSLEPGTAAPWWTSASLLGWYLSLNVFPVSLTIAITKYRLWDIDVVINRALVYGTLTTLLAAAYFGSVALMQTLFTAVSDQRSPIGIVLSTLLIAALFNPIRHRVQAVVDRRFYRSRYDAAQTLARFAATARDEVDLDELKDELVSVVQDTVQPERLGIWLKE